MATAPAPLVGILGSQGIGERLAKHAAQKPEVQSVVTAYGSVDLLVGTIDGARFAAAPKSPAAPFPPHQIPYRAALLALRKSGCDRVLSTSVGTSLSDRIRSADCFLPSDFIDFSGRSVTFFEGGLEGTHHAEMDDPFCPRLVREFLAAARSFGMRVVEGGTIATIAGPHQPTTAEAERLTRAGAVAVNFSAATEAKLARELGMCYAGAVIAVRNLPAVGPWRAGVQEEPEAKSAPTEREILRRIAAGEQVAPPRGAKAPGKGQERGGRSGKQRASPDVEALGAQLRDVDVRIEEAAAAFVPQAAQLDPCPRCPRGAGPAWW